MFAPQPAVKRIILSDSFKGKTPQCVFIITDLLIVSYTMSNKSFLENTTLNDLRNNINHNEIYLSLHLIANKFCPHSDPVRRVYTEKKLQIS